MKTQKELALDYAEAGIKIFPACPKTKKPLTEHGFKDATTNQTKIRNWFSYNPDAFIASPCDGQFTIVDCDFKKRKAFESVSKIFPYLTQTQTRVTTTSNGSHYYFKADEELTRKINFIPDIDILGVGGYAILPDDNTYKQSGSIESFIESLQDLPELDQALKDHLTGTCEIEELSLYRSHNKKKVQPSENSVEKSQDEQEADQEAAIIEENERILSEKTYETSGRRTSTTIDFNGTPLQLDPRSVDKDTVNALFHNKEIQKKIAKHLEIPFPGGSQKHSKAFTSKLPNHLDVNPSMGCRWAESSKGQHLIVRDFSDHYGDGFCDYNLVRLYAVKHKGKTRHMNSPEFYVWFMRLLEDSGVIEIEKPELDIDKSGFTKSELSVVDGFINLLSYKNLYKDGNDETAFSNKFAANWCSVSTALISKAKAKMIRYGVMEKTGTHGEGFFACSLFKLGSGVIKKEEVTKYDINYALRQTINANKKAGKHRSLTNKQTGGGSKSKENKTPTTTKVLNKETDDGDNSFDRSLKDREDNNPSRRLSAKEQIERIKQEVRRRKKRINKLVDDDDG